MQLDAAVAALERTRHVAPHVLDRSAVAQQGSIGVDAPAPTTGEKCMHGHAFELAAQVPQGDIEPADGMDHGPGASEIVERTLEPRRQTSIGRVLAERE